MPALGYLDCCGGALAESPDYSTPVDAPLGPGLQEREDPIGHLLGLLLHSVISVSEMSLLIQLIFTYL